MNKYELHAHTAECDRVANCGGAEIVRMHVESGYSGIVITDHYFRTFFEWFSDELAGVDHQKIISRYLKGYYAAKNEGEKLGFSVICGAEVRIDGTINDYLVYGLEERDFFRLPLLNRLSSLDELLRVLPDSTIVVQAHPFRNKMTICDPSPIFGIEVYNGGTEAFRNSLARTYAEHYGKAMTSGSDFHGRGHLGKGGIVTERKIQNSRDLVELLKSGEYQLVENGQVNIKEK